jgi:two-component system phosphate regulon response regulator PhoB
MAHKEIVYAVEDEEDILELITYNLSKEGFPVEGFTNGEALLERVAQRKPTCIIIDLMLPGMDGLEICRRIRNQHATEDIGLIILTAKGEEADIVSGLELGADDYIVKPFSPRILVARMKALMRRKRPDGSDPQSGDRELNINGLHIHPGRYEVTVNTMRVELTSSEFKALYFLASRPGWVFTRGQIVDYVHGENYPVTDRSVDVMVAGVRKKLGDMGKRIETVRGIGYRFKG